MQRAPRVILSLTYNGDISAKYLLRSVYEHVDEIVLVEARETYSGLEKDTMYHLKNRQEFMPYKSKLSILQIDPFPPMPERWEPYLGMPEEEKNAWFREFYQRNIVKEYLDSKYGDHPYILFCCDADEILNAATVRSIIDDAMHHFEKYDKPHYLEMQHFYFNFNWLKKNDHWRLAFICNSNAIINKSLTEIRIDAREATSEYIIPDGGWHCSFFASTKDIVRKIESYAHRSLDHPVVRDEAHINKCLKQGLDLFSPLHSKPYRGDTTLLKFDTAKLPDFLKAFQTEVLAAQA
jgi:hypothetical protein